jgi:predicted N-acyltransferase
MRNKQKSSYVIAWQENLSNVDQTQWDALAIPLKTPFLEWDWLRQLEISGSLEAENGWLPYHLTVWSEKRLVAAAPLYIKGHSAGEFVFDHAWADLAGRLGIRYYPKMVGMSPFSPVVGYRFLIDSDEDEAQLTAIMVKEIDRLCLRNQISGCSLLFVDPDWHPTITRQGFNGWLHQSYAWKNQDFNNFDDYVAIFNSNQRRNIKRERKAIHEQGVQLKSFTGEEIPRHFFPLMYRYYARTNDQFGPWGCKYLTKSFFEGLYEHYRHRLLIMAAFKDTDAKMPVGMSFLLTKGDQLYGRYWGSAKWVNCLHFDACYYSPIEWAIRHGIRRFDPGAGSHHKLRRGFEAVPNYSLHRFYDPRLRQIMELNIDKINRLEQQHIDELNRELPFAEREPFSKPDHQ